MESSKVLLISLAVLVSCFLTGIYNKFNGDLFSFGHMHAIVHA